MLLSIAGCAAVPIDRPKLYSEAIVDNAETHFGGLAAGWTAENFGKSGFFPFQFGMDALGARLDMAEKAEKSIDLQYFLMKDDAAGSAISTALIQAADRGVRVRFLLDDVFTTAPDKKLLRLSQHPNIEVRLFNPISRRGFHTLNFLGHFRRANRRMHNKSFTVDNTIGIVGGRNIADEYFQLKDDAEFADFDVLTFGPIVQDISASFDDYWNHELAIPVEYLAPPRRLEKPGNTFTRISEDAMSDYKNIYETAFESDLLQDLLSSDQRLFVADARVIADDPDKLQKSVGIENMQLATELAGLLSEAKSELIFVTPYYVPGESGVEFTRSIVDKGVRLVVVTNSLASTNHIPVHSAYSGYRRDLVEMGVELYEARANAGREIQGGAGPERLTLHTKLIVIDRRYLFVGSLNLDPRSIEINAEMGLLIDSEKLASVIAEGLSNDLPATTYRVTQNSRGGVEWHTTIDGLQQIETSEPLSSRWRRIKAWVLKILPEGQL